MYRVKASTYLHRSLQHLQCGHSWIHSLGCVRSQTETSRGLGTLRCPKQYPLLHCHNGLSLQAGHLRVVDEGKEQRGKVVKQEEKVVKKKKSLQGKENKSDIKNL